MSLSCEPCIIKKEVKSFQCAWFRVNTPLPKGELGGEEGEIGPKTETQQAKQI